MRMWMVDPRGMCTQHLLGEHVELHMLAAVIRCRRSIAGYVRNGLVEPLAIERRHAQLQREMLRRGYNHRSALRQPSLRHLSESERAATVHRDNSRIELIRRCARCKAMAIDPRHLSLPR